MAPPPYALCSTTLPKKEDDYMYRRFWLGLGVLVLFSRLAWAARPLDTEDPRTVPQGKGEFQGSVDATKGDDGALVGLKGSLGFGLLPTMDLRLQTALLWGDPQDAPSRVGMADGLLEFKHRLLDETATLPAFLYAITLRFPTSLGASGLGENGVDATLLAVVGKTCGPLTLNWNGGYVFISRDRALDLVLLSTSLEYRVTETWSLVSEVVSAIGVNQAPTVAVLRVGATYSLTPRIKLDSAVGVGVTRASPDVTVTVGTTIALF
jgi:Putative MetA-pathway of phenol degradation